MNYRLHPDAASEHEKQVAYYEARSPGLGARHHAAFRSSILQVCEAPNRFKMVSASDIRRAPINGFPFSIMFRQIQDEIQVLAIAHHRRHPDYWAGRL
ncbi:MAG: type II toxin-antitoxin system RelE/ParE family toxin [Gammaproteobacteria bacterium]